MISYCVVKRTLFGGGEGKFGKKMTTDAWGKRGEESGKMIFHFYIKTKFFFRVLCCFFPSVNIYCFHVAKN